MKALLFLVFVPLAIVTTGYFVMRAKGHSSLGSIRRKREEMLENKRVESLLTEILQEEIVLLDADGPTERKWLVTGVDGRRKIAHLYDPKNHTSRDVPFSEISEIL